MDIIEMLLVEDDFVVRQGIHYSVEWENYGIHICGEAMNGQEALELAEKYHPDLIITDIRMPIMDGLKFVECVRELQPDVSIVILSGYDDFCYAKQAIHMGVKEYLLKPIDADELLECVQKLRKDILSRRDINKHRNKQQNLIETLRPEIHDNLLKKLVFDNTIESVNKIRESLMLYNIRFDAYEYRVDILEVDNYIASEENIKEDTITGRIREFFKDIFKTYADAEIFKNENNQYGIILNDEMIRDVENREQYLIFLQKMLSEIGITGRIYLGDKKTSLRDLAVSYRAAEKKLKDSKSESICLEQSQYSQLVKRALEYTENHYAEELSVKILSSEFCITPNYFSQIFKTQTGDNYTDYVNKVRIRHAKELLKDPRRKIYEISELTGYQNYKYFNTVFKKVTGISPKEYRNKNT